MKRLLALIMAVLMAALLCVCAAATVPSPTAEEVIPVDIPSNPTVVGEDGKPVIGQEGVLVEVAPTENYGEFKITGDSLDGCKVYFWVTPYEEINGRPIAIVSRLDGKDEGLNPNYENVDAEDRLKVANGLVNDLEKTNFSDWKSKWPASVRASTSNRDIFRVAVFDITIWCDKNHSIVDQHSCIHKVSLELGSDQLATFVAMMHFNKDYEWEYVEGVEVDKKNGTISFDVNCDNLSPFAIVSSKSSGSGYHGGSETGEPTSPQTGEIGNSGYWMSCGTFFAVAGVTALYRQKKEKRYAR